jgi:hypothetical protein
MAVQRCALFAGCTWPGAVLNASGNQTVFTPAPNELQTL